jgi:aspartyl-tRNA(Asn)/glutamyl-tRNA(Gln) amidotransferase subunit B
MEQGSLRCDANVSVRRPGGPLGTRAEIKNLNSFRFVQRAIEYEVLRQIDLIEGGQEVVQETRLFNADTGRTFSMRSKEDAHDYRYFPDPDLPPLVIDQSWMEEARSGLPELPDARRERYQEQFGLSLYDASVLTQSRHVADFFDEACQQTSHAKGVANWVMNDVLRVASNPEEDLSDLKFTPQQLGQLVEMIHTNEVTGKIGKTLFERMSQDGRDPSTIADEDGLRPMRDQGKLEAMVKELATKFPAQAQDFRDGKDALMGFFMGQVMKQTRGKADPQTVKSLILEHLRKD